MIINYKSAREQILYAFPSSLNKYAQSMWLFTLFLSLMISENK